MSGMLAVAGRELRSFFVSPIAYVTWTVWLVVCGAQFYLLASFYSAQYASGGGDHPLTAFFGRTTLFFVSLLALVPSFTMRLFAEERSRGTLEMLLAAPLSDAALVLGKYAASLVFWVVMWAPTGLYAWIVSGYGPVDLGALWASYLGVFGVGAHYLAVGLLMSVVTRNQVVAALLTFVVLALLFFIGVGDTVLDGVARDLSRYVSVWEHMGAFSLGIVDSRALIYDASVIAVALLAATQLIGLQRWR